MKQTYLRPTTTTIQLQPERCLLSSDTYSLSGEISGYSNNGGGFSQPAEYAVRSNNQQFDSWEDWQ